MLAHSFIIVIHTDGTQLADNLVVAILIVDKSRNVAILFITFVHYLYTIIASCKFQIMFSSSCI